MSNETKIAQSLSVKEAQVKAVIQLLDEGATIPFISRYRKEVTGSLDEVQVAAIKELVNQHRELDKRRLAIEKSLSELGKLDQALMQALAGAETMAALEDVYLPHRPKRKTRASQAKERGLEPLADRLMEQNDISLEELATPFLSGSSDLNSVEDALAGARDILAERFAEDAEIRNIMRDYFMRTGAFSSRVVPGKEEAALKYKDYYEWSEPVSKAPSHRVLAMRRGEKEQFLYLDINVPEDAAYLLMEKKWVKGRSISAQQVVLAIRDSFKRLLKPGMETELRLLSRKKADDEAIRVFADNVRELLLAAPMGSKRVLAIDPGFRTGCKLVCLNEQGSLLENTTIYPHNGAQKASQAGDVVTSLVKKHKIQAIAIGNGTAGRETESFLRNLSLGEVLVVMVNESGASIYSASDVAREEFADLDLTVRGAVSIGRRLMDPLAELVKIDPKSIGVGQYQHDVDQSKLQAALSDTVISCVNAVGVELNTASKQLLAYVSGLGPALAQSIVSYREEHGPFKRRSELKKVPRLGEKAFEQAAGFLRIRGAENPLDASAVHPERYALVEQMAKDAGAKLNELMQDDKLRKNIRLDRYLSEDVGLPTLKDIVAELAKPGRDPRERFEAFSFMEGVNNIEDLKVGMRLPGIVTNVTKFGAFVDIGVHQDGLVHLSRISKRFVQDPSELVKVQQRVEVEVTEVDVARKRISLSMQLDAPNASPERRPKNSNQRKENPQAKDTNDFASKLAALKGRFSS